MTADNNIPTVANSLTFAAVKQTIDGYSDAINHRDWAAVQSFFCEEATWRTANFREFGWSGAQGITDGLRAIIEPMELLFQTPSATKITIDDDHASARSSIQEFGKAGEISFRCLGSYEDRLMWNGLAWLFHARVFTYFYWEENSMSGTAFQASALAVDERTAYNE
jgi:hypothetical protein